MSRSLTSLILWGFKSNGEDIILYRFIILTMSYLQSQILKGMDDFAVASFLSTVLCCVFLLDLIE